VVADQLERGGFGVALRKEIRQVGDGAPQEGNPLGRKQTIILGMASAMSLALRHEFYDSGFGEKGVVGCATHGFEMRNSNLEIRNKFDSLRVG
jgi:hypothetical protein